MKRSNIVIWIILLVATIILGNSLRTPGYGSIPEPFVILDEHTNVWHGLSIRSSGIPAAWSILDAYKRDSYDGGAGGYTEGFNVSVEGEKPVFSNYSSFPKPAIAVGEFDFGRGLSQTQIVQPYLDHPPFGALVLSLFVNGDAKTFSDLNNYDMRQSALVLAVATQILIFILTLQLTKRPLVGLIASLTYSTVPSYVLMSRYALLENVMSPLILLNLSLFIFAKERQTKWLLILAGVIGGLIALTKLTGWVFVLGFVSLLIIWKYKVKEVLYYLVPAILLGVLYFAWGLYLAPKLFIDLMVLQSGRDFIGSINLLVTFFRVTVYNFPLDGWWIGGFLSLLFIPKDKVYLPLIALILTGIFSATAISGANYPWYFITLIPFMCIGIAIFFYQLAINPSFKAILLAFFTFVSSSFYWGYGVYQKTQPFMMYRFLLILFLGMAAFWSLGKRNAKYKKAWFVGIMALLLIIFALNRRSMFFILDNWGKLPLIYTPGTGL